MTKKALIIGCVSVLCACDPRGECAADGGIWVGAPGQCVRANDDLGHEEGISIEQRKRVQKLCETKPHGVDWTREDIEEQKK